VASSMNTKLLHLLFIFYYIGRSTNKLKLYEKLSIACNVDNCIQKVSDYVYLLVFVCLFVYNLIARGKPFTQHVIDSFVMHNMAFY
jgi:hypothetical protein